MYIEKLELKNFRSYEELNMEFDKGINIIYGNNAQGKTNIIEAVYAGCTSKSHRSGKDKEMIKFGCDDAHIKLLFRKKEIPHRIDIHIRKNGIKGIALDGFPVKKASEILGTAGVVIFSPEDLGIIKNGPSERRRFMDIELCMLSSAYTRSLISYNRTVNQKNTYLKEKNNAADDGMVEIYNDQLVKYGTEIIKYREEFINEISGYVKETHGKISENHEDAEIIYEKSAEPEEFAKQLEIHKNSEKKQQVCLVGPHRDDICFTVNGTDIRRYGSQGQQRTAALSLKLSEILLYRKRMNDKPVLLLDDVLSELDRKRQNLLLSGLSEVQTIMTCTGIDDFIKERIKINRVFYIEKA